MKNFKKGFTLIELMVVITVIAILSTIALFGIGKTQASARDTSRQQIMNGVRTALERYYGDNQAYPATQTFCALVTTLSGYLGATLPIDPKTKVGIVCNPATEGATYSYTAGNAGTCTGAGYTLTLIKESGGTSYFCSPQ